MKPESVRSGLPSWWVAQDIPEVLPELQGSAQRALFPIAEALFTTTAGPPPAARLHWLCLEMRDFLSRAGGRARLLFRLALFLATWIAPLWILRLPPLGLLNREQRIDALNRLEASTLGPPLFALKAIVSLVYYEHPEAAAELGFDGLPLKDIQA